MWQAKYYPRYARHTPSCGLVESNASLIRNHIPWIVSGVCYVVCIITLLVIRWYLAGENRRRDLEPRDHTYDENWVEVVRDDGTVEKVKIPKVFIYTHSMVGYVLCSAIGVLGPHGYSKP